LLLLLADAALLVTPHSHVHSLLSAAGELCPILRAARAAAQSQELPHKRGSGVTGPTIPPYPGLKQRQSSHSDLQSLAAAGGSSGGGAAGSNGSSQSQPVPAAAAAARVGGGGVAGAAAVTAFGSPLSSMDGPMSLGHASSTDSQNWPPQQQQQPSLLPPLPQQQVEGAAERAARLMGLTDAAGSSGSNGSSSSEGEEDAAAAASPPGEGSRGRAVEPKLFVLGNGSGSPCLDLSRVPAALADATVGVDLLVSGSVWGGARGEVSGWWWCVGAGDECGGEKEWVGGGQEGKERGWG